MTKKPSNQRKRMYKAPLHLRGKRLHVHLSKELAKKHGRRSLRVRKGDRVRVMKGQFKGKSGKVDDVNAKAGKVFIEGIDYQKPDGTKGQFPVAAPNVMITDIDTSDNRRQKILKRTSK